MSVPEHSTEPTPAQQLLEMINSSWMAQAAYVAAELRLAELLIAGPRSSADLASATGVGAGALHRLLRALATMNVCREGDDGMFEITPMGAALAADTPDSIRCWTIWWGKHLWPVWGNLLYSIQTGRSARSLLTGTDGFKHLEQDPDAAATFNQALVELTRLSADAVVRAYDFSPFHNIVDVGGGYGQLLAAILAANPQARGVLFDRPHAIDGARSHLGQAGLIDRCEFVSGDFFQAVPTGGDAYVLKSIIHDWNDERAAVILTHCRNAMCDGGRLLLVERVLPQRLEPVAAHQSAARSDLTMLVALAAQERTEPQLHQLLNACGFNIERILPAGIVSVIEATVSR
jgi:orsellinic acid C2-O-methyltransferase